jgi:type IV fimbrial biogenesis protein FimT
MGGFTLIELLVAVAVAATLLTMGVPSFARLLHSARLTDATNALLSSMHLARSEAVKRGSRVTLCKSADGVSCASTGGWEQGWIVFHDVNDDGVRDSTETVIERTQALASSLRATGNSKVAKYVSFIASGGSRLAGGGFQAGTVTVCNYSDAGGQGRQITLNAAGRSRVQKAATTECA